MVGTPALGPGGGRRTGRGRACAEAACEESGVAVAASASACAAGGGAMGKPPREVISMRSMAACPSRRKKARSTSSLVSVRSIRRSELRDHHAPARRRQQSVDPAEPVVEDALILGEDQGLESCQVLPAEGGDRPDVDPVAGLAPVVQGGELADEEVVRREDPANVDVDEVAEPRRVGRADVDLEGVVGSLEEQLAVRLRAAELLGGQAEARRQVTEDAVGEQGHQGRIEGEEVEVLADAVAREVLRDGGAAPESELRRLGETEDGLADRPLERREQAVATRPGRCGQGTPSRSGRGAPGDRRSPTPHRRAREGARCRPSGRGRGYVR